MPRQTTAGRLWVNLAIDPLAYSILQELAPHRRGHGQLVSELLKSHAARQEAEDLRSRIERLERRFVLLRSSDEA
jgi:hypothetical protein